MDSVEATWERREPAIDLTLEQARKLAGDVVRIEPCVRGKANTNVRAALASGEECVIRLYQRDPRSRARDQWVLAQVPEALPVPRLRRVGALDDGTPAAVFDWCPGVHPEDRLTDDNAEEIGRVLGRGLATLAQVRFDGPALFAPGGGLGRRFDSVAHSFSDLLEWSLAKGAAGQVLERPLRRALMDVARRAERIFAPIEGSAVLCHGDYKFPNLVLADAGPPRLTGVLDWEFACAFTPLLDLAILTRHADRAPPGLCEGIAEGYRAGGGALPQDWQRLARVLDLMNLVGFLNGSRLRPALVAAVTPRIARTVREA